MKAKSFFAVAVLLVSAANSQAQIVSYPSTAVSYKPVYSRAPAYNQPARFYAPSKTRMPQAANAPRYQTVQYSSPLTPQPYFESSDNAFFENGECCETCIPTLGPSLGAMPMTGYQPILPIFSMPNSYYVGRGILGQPTVYVPGQTIRNFFRYLGP